jgi:hypothetical protein
MDSMSRDSMPAPAPSSEQKQVQPQEQKPEQKPQVNPADEIKNKAVREFVDKIPGILKKYLDEQTPKKSGFGWWGGKKGTKRRKGGKVTRRPRGKRTRRH